MLVESLELKKRGDAVLNGKRHHIPALKLPQGKDSKIVLKY